MPSTPSIPNHFILSGRATRITYSTTSNKGEPLMGITHNGRHEEFEGHEIAVAATSLGQLITVPWDQHGMQLCVVLPKCNPGTGPVKTLAFEVLEKLDSTAPGAVQEYKHIELSGTADYVEFVEVAV
jgi:hypothetical protein